MTKGIKHKDIGEDLSRTEFEADDSHELESGTSFPGSPVEKDRFYRTDLHEWYIYNGSTWKYMGGVDISDADAAIGDVRATKTFYSVAEPKKTGTLAMAEDQVVEVPSVLTSGTNSQSTYSLYATSSTVLATTTPTFADPALVVGVGHVFGCKSTGSWRIDMELDGVVVASTSCDSTCAAWTFKPYVVVGTKAMVGSKVCAVRLYEVSDGAYYVISGYGSPFTLAAGLGVGSVTI